MTPQTIAILILLGLLVIGIFMWRRSERRWKNRLLMTEKSWITTVKTLREAQRSNKHIKKKYQRRCAKKTEKILSLQQTIILRDAELFNEREKRLNEFDSAVLQETAEDPEKTQKILEEILKEQIRTWRTMDCYVRGLWKRIEKQKEQRKRIETIIRKGINEYPEHMKTLNRMLSVLVNN